MKKLYYCKTRVGTFYIAQSDDGRFHAMYEDESCGSYASAWQAADSLASNTTYTVSGPDGAALDTSKLGIPEGLSQWERINLQT